MLMELDALLHLASGRRRRCALAVHIGRLYRYRREREVDPTLPSQYHIICLSGSFRPVRCVLLKTQCWGATVTAPSPLSAHTKKVAENRLL